MSAAKKTFRKEDDLEWRHRKKQMRPSVLNSAKPAEFAALPQVYINYLFHNLAHRDLDNSSATRYHYAQLE